MTKKPGVLLIGHGTRDVLGTSEFFELGKLLARRCGDVPVASALLEFQEPTIPQAWDTLADHGVRHVRIAPLLLFAAGHAKSDIPEIVDQCLIRTPSMTVDQSRPLSRHPAIIKLAAQRVCESFADSDPNRTAVVMVGRGSHDACASADMRVLSEIVGHRLGLANFITAFYAMAQPRLPNVLKEVASTNRYDKIVVYPHLLFHGRLFQAIENQTRSAADKFPAISFVTTAYLGPVAEVATAIADRSISSPSAAAFH